MNKLLTIKKIATIGLVTGTLLMAGCAADFDNLRQGYSSEVTGHQYKPTNDSKIVLSYLDQPTKAKVCSEYDVIGKVSVMPYNVAGFSRTTSQIATNLKEGAAKMGADAVINISGGTGLGDMVTGYAIHCKA